MAAVLGFLKSVLPWIGIILFMVIAVMKNGIEKTVEGDDKEAAKKFHRILTPVPSIIMFVLAGLEMMDKNVKGSSLWLALAVIFLVLCTMNKPSNRIIEDPRKNKPISKRPGVGNNNKKLNNKKK